MNSGLLPAILLLDLWLGDPHGWPHPVVWIGRLINKIEAWLRSIKAQKRMAGVVLVVLTLSITGFSAALLLEIARTIAGLFGWLVALWLGWSCLALRSLHLESLAVIKELEAGNLPAARQALSMIVGRETANLDEEGVLKATLETVAENTSDGVIAPLFYLLLAGPVLAMLYKAASTLDSMVGYKNEQYLEFGWAGARLDDLLNYIPSRLTGALFIISAYILKMNGALSLKVMLRDASKHSSPNAGWPEAAAAGALNLQLGGTAVYFGKTVTKPTFGDALQQPQVRHYRQLIKMLYLSCGIFTLVALLFQGGL